MCGIASAVDAVDACAGQEEKSAQTLQGALSIEKQLLAVRSKHGQLQDPARIEPIACVTRKIAPNMLAMVESHFLKTLN